MGEHWEKLNKAEREREVALRTELERLNKIEYLKKKFTGKGDLLESWLNDKKVYLQSTDFGDTIQAVQAKIRAHTAFENQVKVHQPRITELQSIIKEINDAMKSQCEEQNRLQVLVSLIVTDVRVQKLEAAWKEIFQLLDARNKALQERLKDRQQFEEMCAKYSKLAEELYVWLEKTAEDLVEPIVVNSTAAVQVMQDSLEKIQSEQKERSPLFTEISELAESIVQGGMADLHQICEYNGEVCSI